MKKGFILIFIAIGIVAILLSFTITKTVMNGMKSLEKNNTKETISKVNTNRKPSIRGEIIERLDKLQAQIDDMRESVKEDLANRELKDEDMFRIKEKMKDLEQNILRIIEG